MIHKQTESWEIKLSRLKKRLNSFNERERITILSAGVIVVTAMAYVAAIEPLILDTRKTWLSAKKMEQQIQQAQEEAEAIKSAANKDPNDALRAEIAQINADSAEIEKKIEEYTLAFVDSRQMTNLLSAMMNRHKGLTLKAMHNTAVTEIQIPGVSQPWLYRHGLRLKIEGNYLDVLEYVRQVERLPRRIQWDALTFEVTEYPMGMLELDIYTLSTSKGWIGA